MFSVVSVFATELFDLSLANKVISGLGLLMLFLFDFVLLAISKESSKLGTNLGLLD
jgi:hypothetical protein